MKIKKLREVMDKRIDVFKEMMESSLIIASNLKYWLIESLKSIEQSNENLTLLIDYEYENLELIKDFEIRPKTEFNRKYRKYLEPKQISLLESLEINFESIVNFNDLKQSHASLLNKLHNCGIENDNSAFLGNSSTSYSHLSAVNEKVPRLEFGSSTNIEKVTNDLNSPPNMKIQSLRIKDGANSSRQKLGFYSPRLNKTSKSRSQRRFSKVHKRTVSFIDHDDFPQKQINNSPPAFNQISPDKLEFPSGNKVSDLKINFENLPTIVEKITKFIDINKNSDIKKVQKGKIDKCLNEVGNIKDSLKKIAGNKSALSFRNNEGMNNKNDLVNSELSHDVSFFRINDLADQEFASEMKFSKNKSLKLFLEKEIKKLEEKVESNSKSFKQSENELKESKIVLSDLYKDFLEKEDKLDSLNRQKIAVNLHLRTIRDRISEIEFNIEEISKQIKDQKAELETEDRKLLLLEDKKKSMKENSLQFDERLVEKKKSLEKTKNEIIKILKDKVIRETEIEDSILRESVMRSVNCK